MGGSIEQPLTDFVTHRLARNPDVLPIRPDTPLIESQILDSLSVLALAAYIEEHWNIRVRPEDIIAENFATIGAICAYVRARSPLAE